MRTWQWGIVWFTRVWWYCQSACN